MGASLYGSYPAMLHLINREIPVIWIDASELLYSSNQLITPRTLLWIVSQSGRSIEITKLTQFILSNSPHTLLITVNDPESPLANFLNDFETPSVLTTLNAGTESTVSSKTYVNTLAITQLTAISLCGQNVIDHKEDLLHTTIGISSYLKSWEDQMERIASAVDSPNHLLLLGRGSSLAATYTGALILGEAAKFPAMSLQAGEFRHGPMEIINPDLTVLIFAGQTKTIYLNRRLFDELTEHKVKTIWIGLDDDVNTSKPNYLKIPEFTGIGMPMAEILPMQLLSIHLAKQNNIEPGKFIYSGKVTLKNS